MKATARLLIVILAIAISMPQPVSARRPLLKYKWVARPAIRIAARSHTNTLGMSPAQIRHAYGFDSAPETGAGQTIAIIDAYNTPSAAADLAIFSKQYNLLHLYGTPGEPPCSIAIGPHPCFEVQSAGKVFRKNASWAVETDLDTEWAHAIAPQADILLVQSPDATITNLLKAVDLANSQANLLSMSWGGPEFATEVSLIDHFNTPGTSYVAASGDNGTGSSFPAALPTVLSVGGTSISLTSSNKITAETSWSGSGGGVSSFFARPGYQQSYQTTIKRAMPDVAYHADPNNGYSVFSTGDWYQVGGTSAGAPQWTALLALANQRSRKKLGISTRSSSLYPDLKKYTDIFHDISTGSNGACGLMCNAKNKFDTVTGLGSPKVDTLLFYLSK